MKPEDDKHSTLNTTQLYLVLTCQVTLSCVLDTASTLTPLGGPLGASSWVVRLTATAGSPRPTWIRR